jgi:DNA-binding response OmpR family regulator
MRDEAIIPYARRSVWACNKGGEMPALQRPHVLIVSDDADLTDFLGEGLVYAGFWTSVIASAVQTLEVFRLRTFDLMLVDAELGGIGATELIRRLRGRSDRSARVGRTDIPIAAITADEALDPAPLLEAGVDTMVAAPIELEDLAAALANLVQQWRATHPGRPWADELAQSPP